MEMRESRLFQMPLEIAVILTQILVFMSIASEHGFESVPRPEILGEGSGGSSGLRHALIKLAS